jgi:hypothetical protein
MIFDIVADSLESWYLPEQILLDNTHGTQIISLLQIKWALHLQDMNNFELEVLPVYKTAHYINPPLILPTQVYSDHIHIQDLVRNVLVIHMQVHIFIAASRLRQFTRPQVTKPYLKTGKPQGFNFVVGYPSPESKSIRDVQCFPWTTSSSTSHGLKTSGSSAPPLVFH